jgi:phosphate transport system substrate-binding protein
MSHPCLSAPALARRITILGLAAAVALSSVTGCARRNEEAADGGGAAGGAKSRPVTVKGSDTMVILVQRWAEKYMAGHEGTSIQVTGGGSGTGIAALVNGTTDICASSRPMKDAEKEQLRGARSAESNEIPVALDALAVYVHETNAVPPLSLDQLKGVYTGAVTNWKDVGGADAPIILYGRENNSGTYAYFKEHVLGNADYAAATLTLPGTAAVTNAVARDPNAIGYGGIAYAKGIRLVPLRKTATDAPVEPTMENAISGTYPVSRFLYFYTAGQPTGEAARFVQWALSPEGQAIIQEVGYFPLPKT